MRFQPRCELLGIWVQPRSVARQPGELVVFNIDEDESYDRFQVAHNAVSRVYPNDERLVTRYVSDIALGWHGQGAVHFSALVARILPSGSWWRPEVSVDVELYDWFVPAGELFILGTHQEPLTRPTPKAI